MNWLGIGLRLLPYIGTAVTAVERFVSGKGKQKEDAAVEMTKTLVETIEGVSAKDLVENQNVQHLVRGVMQAIVALQNGIAAEAPKP